MKQKGFTLVELLATVVILTFLALITSTAITGVAKNSKMELYNTQKELIKSAADEYLSENKRLFPEATEGTPEVIVYFNLSDIQESGILDRNIKNAKTGENLVDNDLIIKTTITYNVKYNKMGYKNEIIDDKDEIIRIKNDYDHISNTTPEANL